MTLLHTQHAPTTKSVPISIQLPRQKNVSLLLKADNAMAGGLSYVMMTSCHQTLQQALHARLKCNEYCNSRWLVSLFQGGHSIHSVHGLSGLSIPD